MAILALAALGTGCSEEDCVNCVELPAPVVPTGVHSVTGDNEVYVYWYDVSYHPYDGQYNENVVGYTIYSRFYSDGDEDDPNREFDPIGYIEWDDTFDPYTGLHSFVDGDAVNGERYEYAVSAVNAAGRESALSYEFVIDAPLPMSRDTVELFDASDPAVGHLGGFDFSALDVGRVDPGAVGTTADIRVVFENGVPYVEAMRGSVRLQDFGVFLFSDGSLDFYGVSWAPAEGYSEPGRLELITGHIYVAEIGGANNTLHYAKFGIVSKGSESIRMHWAYQTIEGWPELSVQPKPAPHSGEPVVLSL